MQEWQEKAATSASEPIEQGIIKAEFYSASTSTESLSRADNSV